MRLPHESLDRLERRGACMGTARAVGRAPRERPARASRRLHVQCPLRRAVARGARLPRWRCRPSHAAVRRPRHVLGACATPPTSPGSSTSCSLTMPAMRCSTATRPSGYRARERRSTSPWSSASVICVPDPAEAAARDEAMAAGVGDEPAPAPGLPCTRRGSSTRLPLTPARNSCRARTAAGGSTRCTATAGDSWSWVPMSSASVGTSARGSSRSVAVSSRSPNPIRSSSAGSRARHNVCAAATRLLPLRNSADGEEATALLGRPPSSPRTGSHQMKLADHSAGSRTASTEGSPAGGVVCTSPHRGAIVRQIVGRDSVHRGGVAPGSAAGVI